MTTTLSLQDKMALHRKRLELPPPAMRRHLREAAGLSQQDLADYLGVTRVSVGRWEAGERTPKGEHLRRYAESLRMMSREVGA